MTAHQPRVLVIEDEPEIRRFLRASLDAHDFDVHEAAAGQEGLRKVAEQPPDIILLDIGLPDISGFEVIEQIRGWSSVPIVVLSARGQEADKITALDAGADDYLTKPFGVGELLARLRVALRHQARLRESDASTAFTAGELSVDLVRRQVISAGKEVHLTPTEYRLLTTLIKHAGKVLTHRQLLKEVWGPDCTHETHYLRVYVNQLRQSWRGSSRAESDYHGARRRHRLQEGS
jgi:two-component system KDP operon response regulator KdpE